MPSYFSSGLARIAATDFPVSSAMEIALLANVSGATSAKIWCVAKRRRMRAWREKVSQFPISNIQYYSIKTPGRRPRCERCVQIGFFGTTEGHLVHRKTPNNSARRVLPFHRRFSFAQISQTHGVGVAIQSFDRALRPFEHCFF